MSNNANRIRELLRELSDISETSSRSNNFNINFYDNSNFYDNFYNRFPGDYNTVNNTRQRSSNIGTDNIINTRDSDFDNTTNTLDSDRTNNDINTNNVRRVTTQVIPIRTEILGGNNTEFANQISTLIQNNLDSLLNENSSNTLSSVPIIQQSSDELTQEGDTPLSLDMLNQKTTLFVYTGNDEINERCHICNESYSPSTICRKNNNCNHFFHQSCIDLWYSEKSICPECNQIIR